MNGFWQELLDWFNNPFGRPMNLLVWSLTLVAILLLVGIWASIINKIGR